MNPSEFINIGVLIRPHGLQGNIELKLDYPAKDISALASFFVEDQPIPLPYFIENLKQLSQAGHYSVQLEDISDLDAARKLKGKKIYCLKSELQQLFELKNQGEFSDDQLMGLELIDRQNKKLGKISDIFENAMEQRLLQVLIGDKEVLIPFVENRVLEFNEKKAFLKYDIPDGLLEIYLD